MWNCPNCNRNFKVNNQSHICTTKDIGELFVDKPDELVLAFDDNFTVIEKWTPNTYGASVHTIVFTSKKAWLIIRPMKKDLDVKFYAEKAIDDERIFKVQDYNGKFAHHIRIKRPEELDSAFFRLLKIGFEYSLS